MSNTSLLGAFGGQGNSSLMFRNVLINGNFDVWQRGTTGTSTGTGLRVADRWHTTINATNHNYTCAQSTDVPTLASAYSLSWTQTAGQNASSINEYALRQVIEKQNTLVLVGKPVTVSFWYKSSVAGTHGVRLIGNAPGYTNGFDQNQAFTVSAANTWEYKTLTFTAVQGVTAVTGDMTGVGMYLDIGPRVGGGGASIGQTSFAGGAYFRLAQVQLEAETATPFERRPYSVELGMAMRYYQNSNTSSSSRTIACGTTGNGQAFFVVPTGVVMRSNASFAAVGTLSFRQAGTDNTITSIAQNEVMGVNVHVLGNLTTNIGNGIAGNILLYGANNSYSIDAEL